MGITQFLNTIQPNITVFAALLMAAFLFIKLFGFFLKYEKELRDENYPMIEDLKEEFKKRHIIDVLTDEIKHTFTAGYKHAASKFFPLKYDAEIKKETRKLVSPNEVQNLLEMQQDELDEFFYCASGSAKNLKLGSEVLKAIEQKYSETRNIIFRYTNMLKWCRVVWSVTVLEVVLSIVGYPVFFVNNQLWIHIWCFLYIQTFVVGCIAFACLFYNRQIVYNKWEKMKIDGEL